MTKIEIEALQAAMHSASAEAVGLLSALLTLSKMPDEHCKQAIDIVNRFDDASAKIIGNLKAAA